jgi:hypothetical protein
MRAVVLSLGCTAFVAACALLASGSRTGPPSGAVKVRLRLVDADSGKGQPGLVRVFRKDARKALALPELFPRLRGLNVPEEFTGWYVVPADGGTTELPRETVRLEALSGLETDRASLDLDLTKKSAGEVVIKLKAIYRPTERGLVAGNTHLHLMKISAEEADAYLKAVPAADGLRVLFISYLERHKDDATYITNRYPIGDLPQFRGTGVLFNNGEEHRHNFKAYGEGYGHVMFLNLRELVKPVSLGPGITGAGLDDRPLRPGIDAARRQGATVLWCHNTFGFEDVPSAVTGRLDALNVFDGTRKGSYEDGYYRYLNVGLRLPLSTGTDWFLYDFSRVYAEVRGRLTIPAWLEALKAGRTCATNGPILSLKVDGQGPGAVLALDKAGTVKIEGSALGRHDFQSLQLVHNGKVIRRVVPSRRAPFGAELTHSLRIDAPGWLALRIESAAKNELGQPLFAHTSPVYVDFQGRRVLNVDAALSLLRSLEEARGAIRGQGAFSSDAALQRVLTLYDEAAGDLRRRIKQPR